MAASDAEVSLNQAIGMSGLLFQPHPKVDGWKTTRPGAFSGEVVAFRTTDITPAFRRLSLRHYEEGEVDEDGYEFHCDTWIVEKMDMATHLKPEERDFEAYHWVEDEYHYSREAAVGRLVGIMQEVSENRNREEE